MKTNQYLSYLRSLGIIVVRNGDRLRFNAPQGSLTPSLLAELQERKAEILAFLPPADATDHRSFPPIVQAERSETLPLSYAQQRLWFLEQMMPANPFYNTFIAWHVHGQLNAFALLRSLNEIIRRHESLRTCFLSVDGQPTQSIASSLELTLPTIDLVEFPGQEGLEQARKLVNFEVQQPFDLTKVPLLRVKLLRLAPDEHVLLFVMHHIISDGWSVGVFHRELSVFYEAFVTGKPALLPDLNIQYVDYALWQRRTLQEGVLTSQLQYWQQQLANLPVVQLPTDYSRPAVQSFRGATEILEVSQNQKQALAKLSQQNGVTLFMTLLAVFKVLLHRYTGQTDIVVGSPIANRNHTCLEPLIGFFVNSLVLRTNLEGNPSFSELLKRVQEVTLEAYAHQELPFEKLVEELHPERHLSQNPLFQIAFSLQNVLKEELKLSGLQLSRLELEFKTTRVDLEWHVWDHAQGLQLTVVYNTDLFAQQTIQRMLGHFQTLLEAVVANPQQRIQQLPLLSAVERQQLLVDWNHTKADYPQDKCFHELFESQVERTPNAVAVVFENEEVTYAQLNVRANGLADCLQSLGVGPEVLVGVCVERSVEMIVGMLGILKAGGAYVPLDPAYPMERLEFMLSNARVSVLLTQRHLVERLPQYNGRVVCLDTDDVAIAKRCRQRRIASESKLNLAPRATTENLAYVIYTSGSTGLPKGVLVTHSGLCNLVFAQIKTFEVKNSSRILQFASLSFDASIWEIVMALGTGATLCLGTANSLLPGKELVELLRQHRITHVTLPPSISAVLPKDELPSLQTIIAAGEACGAELVAKWALGRRFFNAYGPTETTVCATVAECTDTVNKPPIGQPIANTQIYILDAHLQPVPVGVPGELHIGGVSLARGYLNQPELTAQKFIPNPFDHQLGGRLYKSGDLVRYLSDGNIEFLGRIDNQVKLRGFRIELAEVEAVLKQHPAIDLAVAVVQEDSSSNKRLVAYVVPKQENQHYSEVELWSSFEPRLLAENYSLPGRRLPILTNHVRAASPSGEGAKYTKKGEKKEEKKIGNLVGGREYVSNNLTQDIKDYLKQLLPQYMVPSAIVMLESMPLTANGKVNRKALPALTDFQQELSANYVAPETEIEQTIAQVWQMVLQLEKVGIYDSFFDLGGHSLLMAQVHSHLREIIKKDVSIIELFEYPTIKSLANYLTDKQSKKYSFEQNHERSIKKKEVMNRQKQRRLGKV